MTLEQKTKSQGIGSVQFLDVLGLICMRRYIMSLSSVE